MKNTSHYFFYCRRCDRKFDEKNASDFSLGDIFHYWGGSDRLPCPECGKTDDVVLTIEADIEEETMIERPVSEEQCKKLGGHYWNYHTGNDVVNEFGEYQDVKVKNAVHYVNGEPQLRTCGLCGKREKQIKKWEEV